MVALGTPLLLGSAFCYYVCMTRTQNLDKDVQAQINGKLSGHAIVKGKDGGFMRIVWGLNDKMKEDRVVLIEKGSEKIYVSADDVLAVLRNV